MDPLHAIGFYASAALSVGGALAAALVHDRTRRGVALMVAGVGVAGLDFSLSAGFAGIAALVSFAVAAALLARPDVRAVSAEGSATWYQVAGLGAALLFAMLAYAAYRGDLHHGSFFGGLLGTAVVGRLMFSHDAAATVAVAALVLVSMVGATALWRARDRSR